MATPVLGVGFRFSSYKDVPQRIQEWSDGGTNEQVCITNPHSVLLCERDEEFGEATRSAGLVLPDGIGIILAAKILGYPHHGRVTGPTLMLKLCDWGREHGWTHYFYGGKDGVPEQLKTKLCEKFPGLQVVGTHSPPFRELTPEEDDEIVRQINDANPTILWVGLGAPKQEKWIHRHRDRLNATAMIGVGAAFDFHSGNVPWCPRWMRAVGLEWLHRLVLQPRRMWCRNLDSFIFLWKVLGQRMRGVENKQKSTKGAKEEGNH